MAEKLKKNAENAQNSDMEEDAMEEENDEEKEKNLLLKFDSENQNFHFTEKTYKL